MTFTNRAKIEKFNHEMDKKWYQQKDQQGNQERALKYDFNHHFETKKYVVLRIVVVITSKKWG